MDFVRFVLIPGLLLSSFSVLAAPPTVSRYTATTSGNTTLYRVNFAGERYANGVLAMNGANDVAINASRAATSVNGSPAYGSVVKFNVGKSNIGVKVRSLVPKANIVSKLVPALRFLSGAGMVVSVGSALYDWLTDAGLDPSLRGSTLDAGYYYWRLNNDWSGQWSGVAIGGYLYYADMNQAATDSCHMSYGSSSSASPSVDSSNNILGTCEWGGPRDLYIPSICPPGQAYNAGNCVAPVYNSVAISDQELSDRLNNTPIPTQKEEEVLAESVARIQQASAKYAQDNPGIGTPFEDQFPDADTTPQVETPPNITHPPEKTVTPDGSVQTKQSQTTFTPGATPDSFNAEQTDTVTTVNPDGTTNTQTVNNPTGNKEDTDPCEAFPDSLGCMKPGDVPAAEVVTKTDVLVSLSPTSWGSGSCPADVVVNAPLGKTVTFKYAPICTYFSSLAPVLIVVGWLIAGWMVVGVIRD